MDCFTRSVGSIGLKNVAVTSIEPAFKVKIDCVEVNWRRFVFQSAVNFHQRSAHLCADLSSFREGRSANIRVTQKAIGISIHHEKAGPASYLGRCEYIVAFRTA